MASPTLEPSFNEAQRLFELSSLYEVALLLLGSPDNSHLPFEVLTTAMGLTGAHWGIFWLVDGEGGRMVPVSSCGKALSEMVPLPMPAGLQDRLSRADQALPGSGIPGPKPRWPEGSEPALLVPLSSDGVLRGLIALGPNRFDRPYDPSLLELLGLAGHLIAIALERGERATEAPLEEHHRTLEEFRSEYPPLGRVVGTSGHIQHLFEDIVRVASTSCTVLLEGETGTGKQLVAEVLHEMSPRRGGPFVEVDCSAFPETLIDSELFGHVKGAFTGATGSRKGVFELAHGGTLFLDELGNLPLQTQGRLLRVLQERRFRPIGAERNVEVDVRVIVATNSDLRARVEEGSFRDDLFYRVYVYPIRLKPLRERRDDIAVLARHFASRVSNEHQLPSSELTGAVLKRLETLPYPGNVRELAHLVERLLLRSLGKGAVQPEDVEAVLLEGGADASPGGGAATGPGAGSGAATQVSTAEGLSAGPVARPGRERGAWVLEVLRDHRFNMKAASEMLALKARKNPDQVPISDRSSLSYYFKGECFRILLDHGLDVNRAARDLADVREDLVDIAGRKLRGALSTVTELAASAGSREDLREAIQRKMEKLPADYADVVERLVVRLWDQRETGASNR